ncbi:MAG: hypothetical protein RQ867_10465 [Mariprofundaceae bacterium]|nr:hypothetical protein [Mariprofundaceae bacterium]
MGRLGKQLSQAASLLSAQQGQQTFEGNRVVVKRNPFGISRNHCMQGQASHMDASLDCMDAGGRATHGAVAERWHDEKKVEG